jgi:hypothetical protein
VPIRPCPACQAGTPRLLDETSKYAFVWYYRCLVCGHVWSVEKRDGTTIRHVTPLPPNGATHVPPVEPK